ncbi:Calcineurin-like phosphoesterase [Amycolatopsis xylanica]|uniref:Calcineurin-like phosphoesterase n=1 Tax=Amycolatopsis xylanica TaxID=589385 RepID=A0A1H2YHI9_9PSEU|nr:discoidin domain-containing protein [Amycolatopsis xylanica]SDX04435.1 Calcineurin-like phosphoesterase [Amycolatopsis xylanica]
MKRRTPLAGVAVATLALLGQTLIASGSPAQAESLLSAGKPVTASSVETTGFGPGQAVDGDATTRWASEEGVDPQWIAVDLGGTATITKVKLNWEAAYAKTYKIQGSADGRTWQDLKSITGGDGAIDEHLGLNATARHVRVYGTARGTSYGYSLWELEVYGSRPGGDDTQPPSAPTGLAATATTTDSITLGWTASSDNVGVTDYEVLRDGAVVGTSATTAYTDTGLASGVEFGYTVRARDAAGNVSAASAALSASTKPGGTGPITIAIAGDIANPEMFSTHEQTAAQIARINPRYVLTVGDNQYHKGTISEYRAHYDKTWGKFKAITKPTTGNHEWDDQLRGYKEYFGAIAYPKGLPYYSYDIGDFHFVAMDSNPVYTGGGSDQVAWLRDDLARNTKSCVIGYWHHPRFNSGNAGDKKQMAPMWNELDRAKADVVFTGHDHHYERTKPLDANGHVNEANGVRSVIVGIGGDYLYKDYRAREGVEKIFAKHGVMKLVLNGKSYSWEVVDTTGAVLDRAGPYTCR